jgi:hypothetical protein
MARIEDGNLIFEWENSEGWQQFLPTENEVMRGAPNGYGKYATSDNKLSMYLLFLSKA